jgi:kumamolisin
VCPKAYRISEVCSKEKSMRVVKAVLLLSLFVLAVVSSAAGQTRREALPYPTAETPKAVDRGPLAAQPNVAPVSVTVALRLAHLDEAESLLKSLHTPGDPQFHKFLSAEQFVTRFAPAESEVTKVISALAKYGLSAERITATTLRVSGEPAAMERAFGVSLHAYEVPARGEVPGYTFHAPLTHATIPTEISGTVSAVVGLDTQPHFHPQNRMALQRAARPPMAKPNAGGNPPGEWTVLDMANYYDVDPLYDRGLSGKGRTVGIVTLASFTPSDAFTYWSAIGLTVNPNRLQIVNVDGGPGAPSDASGSDETTLDVEQSGGLAPGANIIVYQAPNINQSFLDAFAAAIDSDTADSMSTSWGNWEWLLNLENGPVTDPFTGQTVGFTQATHELLLRAAIQGQTFFAAAGDGGAYDVNNDLNCVGPYSPTQPDSCSNTLSVDYPASDTLMTAAGGTTVPAVLEFCLNAACTPPYYQVTIPHERVWGWDYLEGLCAALGLDPISCGIFPGGGGGGVSITFFEPPYQFFIPGTQLSQPRQVWEAGSAIVTNEQAPPFYALPAFFPGRNMPDVSFNADPETGYVILYTSSATGELGVLLAGGTSFVAPQLNGITALLDQDVHGRVGLLNFALYELGQFGEAYEGQHPALNAIAYGDNWFYHGSNGYNPGAGLGTMNVANFAEALRKQH